MLDVTPASLDKARDRSLDRARDRRVTGFMATDNPTRMEFGAFELDVNARELRTANGRVRLQEQPFVILQMLLERRGQVVTREELRQRLWPAGTFVDFEHSLNAAIKRLRAALGDDADTPRFIETVPRRGYRFLAGDEADEPSPFRTDHHRVRIAVLPFTELGEGLQHDYFGHAFTDEMISQLGRRCRGRLGVISSHSSRAFRNTTATAREIGATLRADYLLEGSIRHNGERVRITARLVETASDTHLWVETHEQAITDWLSAQTDIATRIARSLAMELDAEDPASVHGSRDAGAYQSYLKGRYHWHRIADTGHAEALVCFQDAVARDPSFAAAHAGVAIIEAMGAIYYREVPLHALQPRSPGRHTRAAARHDHCRGALRDGRSQADAALGCPRGAGRVYDRHLPEFELRVRSQRIRAAAGVARKLRASNPAG